MVDILEILKTNPMKCIVRTSKEDKSTIINSLFGFTFNISKYVGGDHNVSGRIQVCKEAAFIGLVLDEDFQ